MSGIATKKRNGDFAVQLTFPTVFQEVAYNERLPYGYYPEIYGGSPVLEEARDLQGYYHEQKRLDAHRRVMNAVRDTEMATQRALQSHAGYYGMPKPVRTQRIYANPSFGNQSDIYSHRPINWNVESSSLRGGVLYTQEAQRWGRNKLKDRIAQLQGIESAKQGFLMGSELSQMPVGVSVPTGAETFADKALIDLTTYLDVIGTAIQTNNFSSMSFQDLVRFSKLLFRYAVEANVEELKTILETVVDLLTTLNAYKESASDSGETSEGQTVLMNADLFYRFLLKVRGYLEKMIGDVARGLSVKEKKASSKAYLKTFFTGIGRYNTKELRDLLVRDSKNIATNNALPEDALDVSDDAVFNIRLPQRERGVRARFDPSVRDRMGANNGAYIGEAMPDTQQLTNPMRNQQEAQMSVSVAEREPETPAFSGVSIPRPRRGRPRGSGKHRV